MTEKIIVKFVPVLYSLWVMLISPKTALKWYYFIVGILFPLVIAAQNQQTVKFSHLSLEDGLSQSVVFQTIQDKEGFLWFGTQDGLNKYDGYKFTVYRTIPNDTNSISNICILSLLEDRNGNIWAGTRGGGLNKFDKRSARFSSFTNNQNDSQSLSNNTINCIFEDKKGTIWVGTHGGGLNQFDNITGKFTSFLNESGKYNCISSNIICSIAEDDSSNLWIGTMGGGLNFFNTKTRTFKQYLSDPNDPKSISNNNVKSILIDSYGDFWIGTDGGGLNKFNPKTGEFKRYVYNPDEPGSISSNTVYSVYESRSGTLWIATFGGGLNCFDRKTEKFKSYKSEPLKKESLSSNYAISLFEDKSKTLWIGTYGGGLSSFSDIKSKFTVLKNDPFNPKSLSSNAIRSIFVDKSGTLWVGTRGGGLNKHNHSTDSFIAYKNDPKNSKSLSNNAVYAILEDQQDVLWIGTFGGGLNKFDMKTGTSKTYKNIPSDNQSLSNNYIHYILDDSLGYLWIATDGGGLNKFDKNTGLFTVYKNNPGDSLSISSNIIISIFDDKQNNLWLGTRGGGLTLFDKLTGKCKIYKNNPKEPKSITNNSVLSIVADNTGTIWIGTDGGGLNKVVWQTDSTKETRISFDSYSISNGLPNNCIYGIVCDKNNNLWLTTNKGISRFSPSKNSSENDAESRSEFQNYDFNDGLPSNEFNSNAYYRCKNGIIYFGSIAGLMFFNPDIVVVNNYKPDVVLTGFQIFNKEVEVIRKQTELFYQRSDENLIKHDGQYFLHQSLSATTELKLSYYEKVFTFEFASLDFTIPAKNKYAYIMEGFEPEWNYVGTRRHATYTNLPHGKYIFKVKGTNCDGLWSDKVKSIAITILPPFWKTLWFRISVIVVIVALIALYIKRRERILREDKDLLEQTVKERTSELKDANEELNQQNEKICAQRDNLELFIDELKQKNEEILSQRDEIQIKNKVIEQKNQNITDSITYAESIQQSILPEISKIQSVFPESFVIFLPKDIVSGDFYWFYDTADVTCFSVIDCTGHGVPGALLSVMGYAFLRKAVHEAVGLHPSDILSILSTEINTTLRKSDKNINVRDGMDIAFCTLHKKTLILEYAGVRNPVFVLRNQELIKLKADKHPIGDAFTSTFSSYNNNVIQLAKGDILYLFTDGIIDQFGGPKGQKFSSKQFEELILNHSNNNLLNQKSIFEDYLNQWKQGYTKAFEQTDDITLIGIKV